MRLLDPITAESGNEDTGLSSEKTCQIIDQLVELPIEHQIFDIIDAAGSCGITLKEICERLGIELKKSHIRLVNLCYRFGMKVKEEQCLKSKTIRVWTSKNYNLGPEVELICKRDENKILNHVPDSSKIISEFVASTASGELADQAILEDILVGAELSTVSPTNIESNFVETSTNLQDLVLDQRGTISSCKFVSSSVDTDNAPSGAFPSEVLKQFSTGSYKRCASFSLSDDNTRRANRILERLKDERFILKPELNRWLNSFEKDKSTKVDRKTIDRILSKLQEQEQVKCMTVHSPVISEYSRTKDCVVVLRPSMSLSQELFDEIQDRIRSFNNYIRKKSTLHQKNDELIPVMEDIQKNQSIIVPDGQVSKSEAMRVNGFVLAKMIRAKLLHSYIWDCLHRSTGQVDALSSKICEEELTDTPHSTSKLFTLEEVVKEMPVELFLQVVGSTKKYEELIEMCKMRLRLSNLPPEEYKCLMDCHAKGRLSLVIDILRRLKLIRMVTDLQSRDAAKSPHTHTMELSPYIEEPISNYAASSNFISLDLRPRVRHDFTLSNRDAVNEYWKTLEYYYATADRKAASYAFPGSVVQELFRFRSWASAHVMTVEQRAELLKHVTKDNLSEKISLRDFEKSAKELNLTMDQVLSMYSCKRRRHLVNQFKDEENDDNSPEDTGNASCCRKNKSTDLRPAKRARTDALTDVVDMHIEEPHNLDVHSEDCATDMQEFGESMPEGCTLLINQCVLNKMKATRRRRFIWSDKTDRQLVIQYVKHRAVLGARYHRVDWTSISDLPTFPATCMRRMNLLNANSRVRKAVNKLCNILSERYAKHLLKSQNMSLNSDECKQFVRSLSCEGISNNSSPDSEIQMRSLKSEAWDDFENKNIKTALEEILRCKMMAKLDSCSQKGQLQYEGCSDASVNADGYESPENKESTSAQSHHGKAHSFSSQRSRRRRLDKKITRFLNNMANVYGQVNESLAISNAVELFKLVFLSTSTGPQPPNLLADILRRYSEHDLFAAFNYLREKKIMVGGTGSERFELSQQFLQSVSKSPFPYNTGKQAVKFSAWLDERGKDLTEVGANISEDLQCGDIFHLFALVSSGDISVLPCLPDNGVGEAEDLRSAKRNLDVSESSCGDRAKKPKSAYGVEGEIISRREKGFPGIAISAYRTTISKADILNLFKDNDNNGQPFGGDLQLNIGQSHDDSISDHMLEIVKSCDPIPVDKNHTESPWEAMAGYAHRLSSEYSNQEHTNGICAEVFRVVYAAIQKAGDQGLSMGEISKVINLPGAEVDGLIVDALQAFGLTLKVNAYDTVRVVDVLYRHKYFLTSGSDFHRVVQPSSTKAIKKSNHTCELYESDKMDTSVHTPSKRNTNVDNMHRVTILNLPCEDVDPENQPCDGNESCKQDRFGLSRVDHEKETLKISLGDSCVPILPWINGDGTINNIVYRGLRRRVLGIVMQSPGMLADDILRHMHVLNPQSCRTLLEMMVLDKHLIVRKMHQNIFEGGPTVLQDLIRSTSSKPKLIYREHFFANPMSTDLL
ncbi:uncharacterized protein LOC114167388 isoform X2 [Vigna unguiculata]|nr:uncharacterized protein LOC114167388 isoform X2 [Vigna unguiculata]